MSEQNERKTAQSGHVMGFSRKVVSLSTLTSVRCPWPSHQSPFPFNEGSKNCANDQPWPVATPQPFLESPGPIFRFQDHTAPIG